MKKAIPIKKSKRRGRKIALIVILIILLAAIYLNFFFIKPCKNKDCFDVSLARCARASYEKKTADATWLYKIEGRKWLERECVVYVENLWLKDSEKAPRLLNKNMLCYLPLHTIAAPESNLDSCHGLLKEAMQDLIIEKMHLFIVQNIGQIKEELQKPL